MSLKEVVIKKIDELILKGEEVYVTPYYALTFAIGEIKALRSVTVTDSDTSHRVRVLGASMPLDAQDAATIYDYLESCYHERLEKEVSRKRESALKYLGVI